MLLITNRPAVYVIIDGVTVELEVDKPTEVSDKQGANLIKRQICMAVIETPERKPKSTEQAAAPIKVRGLSVGRNLG